VYAPNLGTPRDVIERLVRFCRRWRVNTFVDAGCGDGDVLVAMAEADVTRRCIGIEIDPAIAARTTRRIAAARLTNAEVVQRDALAADDVLRTADCVYAFLGGALHQALGHRLADQGGHARYVTALYPAIDLPMVGSDITCSLALEWYEPGVAHERVVWDSPLSISIAHAGGAQLSCRTATVYGTGTIEARVIADPALPIRVGVVLGRRQVSRGTSIVIDVVVRTPARCAVPEAVCELELSLDGRPLTPRHTIVVGASAERAIEHRAPFPGVPLDAALELAAHSPSTLVQLVTR
jgi:SAM-dependent methyltransferase